MFRNYLVNFILNYVFFFFVSPRFSFGLWSVYNFNCIIVSSWPLLEVWNQKLDNVIRTSRLSWMHKALSHSLWSIESLFIVVLQCQLISFWSHTCGDSSSMIWTDYWRLLAFLKCPNDRVKSNYCIQ